MAKITTPDKASGQEHSAIEYNEMKASINAVYDALFEAGVIGVLKTAVLPESTLSPDQFEALPNGQIGLIGFDNIGTGGGGLPKPLAPIIVVDTVGREISFTHDTYPDDIEYRVNGGIWSAYTAGTLVNFGSGAIAANYYQARVEAIPTETQSGTLAGNNYISAAGGDANLMDGYTYLNLASMTGTPPLQPSNNTWKITGDGYGQGQPGKRFPVGANIAFQYQSNSANTQMCVGWNAGSLGNYKSIVVEVDASGILRISGPKITENEAFPTQPTAGQFVNIVRLSGAGSPSIFEVQILGADGVTSIATKQYSVADTASEISHIEYDTAGGSAVINKPQGKNLTDVA